VRILLFSVILLPRDSVDGPRQPRRQGDVRAEICGGERAAKSSEQVEDGITFCLFFEAWSWSRGRGFAIASHDEQSQLLDSAVQAEDRHRNNLFKPVAARRLDRGNRTFAAINLWHSAAKLSGNTRPASPHTRDRRVKVVSNLLPFQPGSGDRSTEQPKQIQASRPPLSANNLPAWPACRPLNVIMLPFINTFRAVASPLSNGAVARSLGEDAVSPLSSSQHTPQTIAAFLCRMHF
jgi:hypothetical protein